MFKQGYVAFDLGAESGRTMLAVLADEKIELHEINRFANEPQWLPSGLHWNLLNLWQNLVAGLRGAGEFAREHGIELISLGVDTWGVDFGLVGKSGQLLGLPYAYRDPRNPRQMRHAIEKIGEKGIYDATGIQFMPFNTLYQMMAQRNAEPTTVEYADHLLNMPDLLHYFFSGEPVNEATVASTTQMVDPHTGDWHRDLLKQLAIPDRCLGKIVPAGTVIGKVRKHLAKDAGIDPISVIVPGSHDTASAIAAVPLNADSEDSWAYLSSGTWSLMGAELDRPIVNDAARQANFTNERGVADKIRFLKNISGLWLVQEVRRDLEHKGRSLDYAGLTEMAEQAEPFRTLVDPDHAPFAAPGDMCAKIDAFAEKTDQPAPTEPGQYVRCCLESLAYAYRQTMRELEGLLNESVDVLHIVGGGGKNALLNRLTADATGKRVVVGPYEATAIGNALTQAIGAGHVRDLAHLRQIVRNSFELVTCGPTDATGFDQHADRYAALLKG